MGKGKGSKAADGIPQKHLHSRISFLHQAAAYLLAATAESQGRLVASEDSSARETSMKRRNRNANHAQSRYLVNQIQGVSRKSQIRLGRDVKHSICKKCDVLLIPGRTSLHQVRNESRDGAKTWADVFEIRCLKCDTVKRFPLGKSCQDTELQPRREDQSNALNLDLNKRRQSEQ
jgi:ribonuclease P protein subunit RPR2